VLIVASLALFDTALGIQLPAPNQLVEFARFQTACVFAIDGTASIAGAVPASHGARRRLRLAGMLQAIGQSKFVIGQNESGGRRWCISRARLRGDVAKLQQLVATAGRIVERAASFPENRRLSHL
jgi:hypothetical protein